jgi:hypothetical protein
MLGDPCRDKSLMDKNLDTPHLDAARALRDEFQQAIEAEVARCSQWWQWRYWRLQVWCWWYGL